jgi:hypothetical protein
MENKKADITSAQLITVIILVGSFLVVLGFIFLYPWNESDREVCHQSLILRSGINTGIFKTSEIVPLKCKTEKICIRTSSNEKSEKCPDFGESNKENPITYKKVTSRSDILDVLAEAHYDCHVLVGEGNLDFEPHGWLGNPYGLICSRIIFSEDTKKKYLSADQGGNISFLELYQHMSKMQTKTSGNYLQFIYHFENSQQAIQALEKQFSAMQKLDSDRDTSWFSSLFSGSTSTPSLKPDEKQKVSENYNKFNNMGLKDWKIDSSKEQAVLVQIVPKGKLESVATSGIILATYGGVAILMVVAPPAGIAGAIATSLVSVTTTTGVVLSGVNLYYSSPGGEFVYVAPTIYEYSSDVLRGLNIYEFSFEP